MDQKEFSELASTLPINPGIYKYYNQHKELLYVGKAKNIRKRVSSYFTKTNDNRKTIELVKRIKTIEFTIVNDETDAFLLENNLIKKFQPPFNINLKDDKTYPYIVIKKENFPRVFFTRRKGNDSSEYFGPYTSIQNARELFDFIKQTILLRTCTLNLSDSNIQKKKFKVCLEYHLGNCKGPCEGLQSKEDYENDILQLKNILKGNLSSVIAYFKQQMNEHVKNLEFEKAALLKSKIQYFQEYKSKSTIVNEKIGNIDVFSILEEGDIAFVNFLSINNGHIVQTKTITLHKKLDEPKEEILIFAIGQIRETYNCSSTEIIIPFPIEYPDKTIKLTIPKSGDKKNLLELSEKNVNYFRFEIKKKKLLQVENKSGDEMYSILKKLQSDLHLKEFPQHIECFDNSNFQGSFPVSAMVCFKDGMPSKNDYRKYNVKNVVGIDDFGTMKDTVYRRYKRLLEENEPLPQLIIIDGGKGQLNAALESIIELKIDSKLTVIGLAKNEEELFFQNDKESIKLPWDDEGLKLIRRIRDEVHRFGITFHRNQRSKKTFVTELDIIEGIGPATIKELLSKFKSIKNIKTKSANELAVVIGHAKAKLILEHYSKKQGPG
jgi:excinuclease ABC subunit C